MMYRLLDAAVLVSILKKKYSTTRLMGPPPMPKKLDMTPSTSPMTTHTGAAVTLWVRMRLLFTVYTSVPSVMIPRQAACTAPTLF